MRAGKLNKRVTIQTPATGQDETGEPLTGWTNFVTEGDGKVWASITDVTGREFFAANAEQSDVQTKIGIRYLAGVIPSMRVLHGSVAYDIKAVLENDNKSSLLMCVRLP